MRRWSFYLAILGGGSAIAAVAWEPARAADAARQVWPAFVLVAGLLLIGLVAADDGLFAVAGYRLAAAHRSQGAVFVGVAALVLAVTAVLNLDTSVAFLAPVAVYTARRRDEDPALLLSACLLLSNAGSLLLPGSNLTNLIVAGHLNIAGGTFVSRMGLPALVAGVVTAGVIALFARRSLSHRAPIGPGSGQVERRAVVGVGMVSVVAAVALLLGLSSPALGVVAVGVVGVVVHRARGRTDLGRILAVLDLPVLGGLFGLAVAVGTLGRGWSYPARELSHLDPWATAAVAAVATILINNLPAASLLSSRLVAHPLSLLVGLNIGPNLFVSGSLSWVLWYNAARASGARPDVRRTVLIGLVAAPLAGAAAIGTLVLIGRST